MKPSKQNLGFDFWKASCLWRKKIENGLASVNLTHPQYIVLSYLKELEAESLCQKELSIISGIDVATLSQIVRGLEKKMLLKRKHLKGDERAKYLKITIQGKEVLKKATEAFSLANHEFFEPLSSNRTAFEKQIYKLLYSI